jgi:hypothetical protein
MVLRRSKAPRFVPCPQSGALMWPACGALETLGDCRRVVHRRFG